MYLRIGCVAKLFNTTHIKRKKYSVNVLALITILYDRLLFLEIK